MNWEKWMRGRLSKGRILNVSIAWILLSTAAVPALCQNRVPTIISLSPPSAVAGGPGFTLMVTGTDFASGAVVQWNGANRVTNQSDDDTVLYASIPASDIASVGTATVTVVNPAPGGGTSNPEEFTILAANPAPTLSSLNPNTIPVAGDGFILTVQGSGFVGSSTVRWNGSDRATSYISTTTLGAYIPPSDIGSAGKAEVTVFNPAPGGGVTDSQLFFVTSNPKPTLISLNPSSVTASGPDFTLNVYGSNFVKGSKVRWNGSERQTSTIWAEGGQLFATIPSADIASVGAVTLTVFNPSPGGGSSNSLSFSITSNPKPKIGSISPSSTLAGGQGLIMTVHGTNLVSGSAVRWNGSAMETNFKDSESLTVNIPASDIANPGEVTVTVSNPSPGGGDSNSAAFNITNSNPVPTISGLVPRSTTVGGTSLLMHVIGSNFVKSAKIRWNGTELPTTSYTEGPSSYDVISAVISADKLATAGTASVEVVNPSPGGGVSTNAVAFTINGSNPKPTITELRPNSATASDFPGPMLVIGSNFAPGARVRWNGMDRNTQAGSSDGTVLDFYPLSGDLGKLGTAQVTVFNPGPGGGASNSMALSINANNSGLLIAGISPNSVPAAQSNVVVVTGRGFQNGVRVLLGGVSVPVNSVGPNQIIVATIADSIPGTYDVTVVNPDGGSAVLSKSFSYSAVTPILHQLIPDRKLEAGDSFTLDVYGENFLRGSIVYWNGSSRVTRFIDSTHLVGSISTSDITNPGTIQVNVSPNGVAYSNSLPFLVEVNDSAQFEVDTVLPVDDSTLGNTRIRFIGQNFKPSMLGSLATTVQQTGEGGVQSTALQGLVQILIDGKPATDLTFVSESEIDGTTPAHGSGNAGVTLSLNGVTESKAKEPFKYKELLPVQSPAAGKSRITVPFIVDTRQFRTNLGINNPGSTQAAVDLLLVNPNGEMERQINLSIPAHGMSQLNNVARVLEGVASSQVTGREGYLIVDSNFPVEAWASQIDNQTQDSSFEQGRRESAGAERIVIPSSSSISPFRTSLIVINNSPIAGTVEIRSWDAAGKLLATMSEVEIRPSGYLYYEDLHRVMGQSGVYGPIEVVASGGIMVTAVARVFTQQGTSGYFEGLDPSQASLEPVVPYTLESMDFRTNLGITNPGNQIAVVTVNLVDVNGRVQGSRAYAVLPHGLTQVNRVNKELGGSGEGYLRLKSNLPIIAWTSQIDNLSQDLSLEVAKADSAANLLIPSSVSSGEFKSMLTVVNQDSTENTVQVTAWDSTGNATGSTRLTIPGYGMISDNDILGRLGLDGSYGPLEIESLDGKPILAVSRVYSSLRTGGYFEGVPIEH